MLKKTLFYLGPEHKKKVEKAAKAYAKKHGEKLTNGSMIIRQLIEKHL